MWYAAHVVMVFRHRQGEQASFPVWENVYLVEADSPEQAHELAQRIGREDDVLGDPTTTCDKVPVRLTFAGVRKVVSCCAPVSGGAMLSTGTELTFSEFTLDSEDELRRFADGQPVGVRYEE